MRKFVWLAIASLGLAVLPASAQRSFDDVKITSEQVAPGVAALFGAGGNIVVSYGEDGTILIDDQFAPLSDRIKAAVKQLGAAPARYIVNTHWHGDHTGGNENFASDGATIFAHDNVRIRLASAHERDGKTMPPAPKAALPVVTFDRGLRFHLNGDTIDVMFIGGGHTDGDSIVRWREKNVIHMGDLYFNIPGWPYIDVASGGNIEHLLFSIDSAIAMMDDKTRVIPGHGALSNRGELIAYRNVLGEAVTRIRALKEAGKSLEEAKAARPLDSFERGKGFIDEDGFIEAVWETLG